MRLQYLFDLALVLTQKEIKVRYKSSFLGYLWSVANPLLYALIFYFVFKVIMKFNIKHYTLFLISGLFPWQWISSSISSGAGVYVNNSALIKKIIFPRSFLPLVQVLNDAFHFVVSLPIIAVFLFIYHMRPGASWFYGAPLWLVPTFFITLGLALAVASINLFFRDLQYFVGLFLTILFYLTPIFYDISFVPRRYRPLIFLNPFTPLITGWRQLLMANTVNTHDLLLSLGYAGLLFLSGFFIYRKLKSRFAEVL